MKGEYYLGLDMGSSSVGWAVTNEKYEILRAHGKTLWGVRLFDSAQTAEERRGFRTAKRRLDRRPCRGRRRNPSFVQKRALRAGSGNLHRGDKWNFCLISA